MSFDYIRQYYKVPAEKGRRIRYSGGADPVTGEIVGTDGQYIKVAVDDELLTLVLHPTWKVEYLDAPQQGSSERGDG